MALVDMKRSEPDDKAGVAAYPVAEGGYPYGLVISLDKDELAKLGITKLPEMGAEFHGLFVACVTRIEQSANEYGDHMSMSLQITMLDMKEEPEHPGEGNETAADEAREFRSLLSSY